MMHYALIAEGWLGLGDCQDELLETSAHHLRLWLETSTLSICRHSQGWIGFVAFGTEYSVRSRTTSGYIKLEVSLPLLHAAI